MAIAAYHGSPTPLSSLMEKFQDIVQLQLVANTYGSVTIPIHEQEANMLVEFANRHIILMNAIKKYPFLLRVKNQSSLTLLASEGDAEQQLEDYAQSIINAQLRTARRGALSSLRIPEDYLHRLMPNAYTEDEIRDHKWIQRRIRP